MLQYHAFTQRNEKIVLSVLSAVPYTSQQPLDFMLLVNAVTICLADVGNNIAASIFRDSNDFVGVLHNQRIIMSLFTIVISFAHR